MKLSFQGDVSLFQDGVRELAPELKIDVCFCGCTEGATVVDVAKGESEDDFSVSLKDGKAAIVWGRRIHFFRALGLLVERLRESGADFDVTQHMYFTMNGPMYDVSQGNAVINVRRVKRLLRTMAVMGLDMLMLYCEDSYEVKTEPYFGYMRGRYTEEDMRELDDYADSLGIEMIPCIQTLAHLTDPFRWTGIYGGIMEDKECLFVGEERTYEFVRHLLEAATRPFRTRRIHIGMDEAWQLGRGSYLTKHGLTPKTEIMRIHLERVMAIIREMGLQPMMWSDMFFRSFLPGGGYYAENVDVPQEVIDSVPKDMQIVYWDYYHEKQDFYEQFARTHMKMGNTVFAGGIWTWTGYGPNYAKTFKNSIPAVMGCKAVGLREVFITIWGDNGTECSIDATLPGLAFYAEHGYNADISMEDIARRFEFCTGAKWDDFMLLQGLDAVPGVDPESTCNCAKFLMWQDILMGMFDKNIEGYTLDEHYEDLAAKLAATDGRDGYYNDLMRFNYHVADVLALKSEIGLKLTAAYKSNDRMALEGFASDILPDLYDRVQALRKAHKEHWFATYKAPGWDVMDMRYGSLLIRIQSAMEQVEAYLGGNTEALAELDEVRLPFNGSKNMPGYVNYYGKIVSASRISPNA